MSTVKVGMIGVGGVGEIILRTFANSSFTTVVAVADTNKDRLDAIQEKYQIQGFENYKTLLENEEIELVYIGVPPKFHHQVALDVMAAGKHILCEKPLANSLEEAKEMAEEAQKRDQVYAIHFPTIYSAAYKEMEALIKAGDLGTIQKVEVQTYFKEWPRPWQQNAWINTREQGGYIREVFPHYIQMIQRLLGSFTLDHSAVQYPEDELLCETSVIASGKLDRGVPVLFNGISNTGMEEYLHFTVYGTERTVSLVNWRDLWVTTKSGKEQITLPQVDHRDGLVANVVKAIQKEPATVVTFTQGYEVQKVLESFYQ